MNIDVKCLQDLANNSRSYRELGRKLNKSHSEAKRLCYKYNIDISKIEELYSNNAKIGRESYNLKVLEIKKVREKNGVLRIYAVCKCVCGNLKETRYENVRSGRVVSCGCLIRKSRKGLLLNSSSNYKGIGELSGTKLLEIQRCAKRRNIIFALDKEYLWNLYLRQGKKCKISGLDIVFGPSHIAHLTTASLDRIDSSKGYIKDNVQWVHKDINRLKGIFDQNYFVELCNNVSEYQKQNNV